MTSPTRSVTVRLGLDPSSFIAGASRAESSTLALDRAVSRVGPSAGTSMEQAARGADRASSSFGKTAASLGAVAAAAAGIGTLAFLADTADTIKLGNAYQGALNQVQAVTGATAQQMAAVRVQAKALGNDLSLPATSASDAALAMENLAKGGLNVDQAMQAAKGTLQLAAAAQIDGAQAADIQSAALNTFHLQADQANHVADVLANTANMSAGDISDFALGLQQAGNVASVFGIGIEDTSAALGIFANNGLKGSDAGTSLKTMLTQLTNQSKPAQAAMKELGLHVYDAQGHFIGLAGLSDQLSAAQKRMSDQEFQTAAATVFGTDAIRAAAIMAKTGGQGFEQFATGVGKAGGASTLASAQMKGLGGAWEGLQSQIETQQLDFYDAIAPDLEKAVRWAQDMLPKVATWMGDLKDEAATDFQAVVRYLQPLISGVEDFAGALFAADGPAEIFWHGLQTGGHIVKDVVDDLHPLVVAGGEVLHLFSELPGPVQLSIGALVALKAASSVGMLDPLKSGIGTVRAAFSDLRSEMELQAALAARTTGGLSDLERAWGGLGTGASGANRELSAVQRMMSGWDDELARSPAAAAAAEGGVSRFSGVVGALGTRALPAAKTALSGLVGMFGGPWGIAIAGAVIGVGALESAIAHHDQEIKQATTDVLAWNKAIALNPGGKSAVDAQQHLADLQNQIDTTQGRINALLNPKAVPGRGVSAALGELKSHLGELKGELATGTQAWKDQLAAMTPVEEMQARVDAATTDLNNALKNNPLSSQAVTNASIRLREAQAMLAVETTNANNATKTQAQLQQDAANAMLASVDAGRAAELSQLQLSDAVDQYNKDVADGQHSARQLREEQLGLVSSARQTAQAAAEAADAQDKQNGITDTAKDKQDAFIKSLQASADQMTGPAKQAILDMIAQLGKQQSQAVLTSGAISALGVTVTSLPNEHTVVINVPTDAQMKSLHDLGYVTVTLPDGHVVVTADTHPAMDEINALLQYARTQAILYRATLPSLVDNSVASGSGRPGLATGGYVRGPGTGTSDSVLMWGSDGEFMVRESSASSYGPGAMQAVNEGRAQIIVPGFAAGGMIGPPGNGSTAQIPVRIDPGSVTAVNAGLHAKLAAAAAAQAAAASFAGSAGGNPAMRALGQQIAANMGWASQFAAIDYIFSHESGWNPNAQNPTSSAYGIPQMINSTWAAYGGKTNSPGLQITDGIEYMVDRFGSPNAAAAFWASHHWYHDGGPVLGPAGANVPAVLKVGETVRTADQEQTVQARLRTREVAGTGGGWGGRTFVSVAAPIVKVYLDGQEWRGIARVEVDSALGELHDRINYAGG